VLEHPTGLPNLQPSHESPAPSALQAPVTLKPDGIGGKKKAKKRGGIGRERRELLNYNSIHNATLTER